MIASLLNPPSKIRTFASAAVLLGASLLCVPGLLAQDMVRYKATPASSMTIAGTSTAHDWTIVGRLVSGFLELPAGVTLDQSKAGPAVGANGQISAKAQVLVPVTSLKGDYQGMDEVMQQAMDAKNHPLIQYQLTEMTFKQPHTAGKPLEFDTKGNLVVNGVTNVIAMPVSIETTNSGKLKISGKIALKMTDYKVKPPVLVILKTGDDITLTFDWLVAVQAAAPAPAAKTP